MEDVAPPVLREKKRGAHLGKKTILCCLFIYSVHFLSDIEAFFFH